MKFVRERKAHLQINIVKCEEYIWQERQDYSYEMWDMLSPLF